MINVLNGKLGVPAVMLFAAAFILALVSFIVAVRTEPYSGVCQEADYVIQCRALRAAIALDGVLWYTSPNEKGLSQDTVLE